MNEIFNHLWQSTAFAGAVALASVALRRNSPRLRYWLWLAASLKFLVPFSLLVSMGARIRFAPDTPSLHAVTVQRVSTYFAPVSIFPAAAPISTASQWPSVLAAIWIAGALFLLIRWFRQWRTIHLAVRSAKRLSLQHSVPTFSSSAMMEPGVFGIFRPVLLLPEGIADNLTPEQFDAVLAHESRHVRYRDNLTAALHMCVETIFWFHPLVWWIGARLMEERERDCDEVVLRQGSRPADYARGIVQVCEAYLESPLACAAGISGSDLKKRIREIMTWRGSLPVTLRARAIMAGAALATVSIPFVIGILHAQMFEVTSVKANRSGSGASSFPRLIKGKLSATNAPVRAMLQVAYGLSDLQINGPGWIDSDRFDLAAISPEGVPDSDIKPMLQALLKDRFQLVAHLDSKEMPVYNMVIAKQGLKIKPFDGQFLPSPPRMPGAWGMMVGNMTMGQLADNLAGPSGRPVFDKTGLEGRYHCVLQYAQPGADAGPLDIFAAVQEQLGLKLEPAKGSVEMLVVDHIERTPSKN